MTSNGALLNRCGSAVVAAMAHNYGVPLIVCCETCKFSDRAHLDSISLNELCTLVCVYAPSFLLLSGAFLFV